MTDSPYEIPEDPGVAVELGKKPRFPFFKLLIAVGIMLVLLALLLPAISRDTRGAARRVQCKNNLKQIAFALHNYADHYGAFPPACTVDAAGRRLHSWRTLILPWLDQQPLYDKIDLSKPWDDPANAEVFKTIPLSYRCPSATLPPNCTGYLGVVGEHACFHPGRPRPITEIIDGTSSTMMVFEVAEENAVHWMSPLDASEEMVLNFATSGTPAHTYAYEGGNQVVLADGSVRFISGQIPPETLHALISIAGNDPVGEF